MRYLLSLVALLSVLVPTVLAQDGHLGSTSDPTEMDATTDPAPTCNGDPGNYRECWYCRLGANPLNPLRNSTYCENHVTRGTYGDGRASCHQNIIFFYCTLEGAFCSVINVTP